MIAAFPPVSRTLPRKTRTQTKQPFRLDDYWQAEGLGGDPTYEKIIRAAAACFERYSVSKTTIDDVAKAAGVSRPTVYKYFPNKDSIIDRISAIEASRMTTQIRKRIKHDLNFQETLTQVFVIGTRIAVKNPYIRRFLESIEVASRAADPDQPIHKYQREQWGHFLNVALERKELATDISRDEIISWLALAQSLILIKVEARPLSDEELRRFVSRFVVYPLMRKIEAPRSARPTRHTLDVLEKP
jgi:AcrR family transcriptional regulator